MLKNIVLMGSVVMLMPACVKQSASPQGLAHLEIGMSKRQVRNVMRSDGKSFGAIALPDGSIQEIVEYAINHGITGVQHSAHAILTLTTLGIWGLVWAADAVNGRSEVFWMTFINGRLSQYGHPQDWQTPPTHIQEFRVR